jgi:hypothetical protein
MPLIASQVVDRYLIALEDVPVYNYPNGTRIGTINKGNATARVYSFLTRPGGQVWFMFDYTIPGTTPSAYYVLDKDGRFRISQAPGNAEINPSSLPSVDVFPKGGDKIKTFALYGIIGVLALLLLKK